MESLVKSIFKLTSKPVYFMISEIVLQCKAMLQKIYLSI